MPDLRIGQADCVNFLVVRLYSGEARCHHPGNVEDRCPGYHRLQLIVNLQLSQDKTLKKKKKKESHEGPQSLSHAASCPPFRDLMLVWGQTSGSQSPHLVAPSCKEGGPWCHQHFLLPPWFLPRTSTRHGHGPRLGHSGSSPQTFRSQERKKALLEVAPCCVPSAEESEGSLEAGSPNPCGHQAMALLLTHFTDRAVGNREGNHFPRVAELGKAALPRVTEASDVFWTHF